MNPRLQKIQRAIRDAHLLVPVEKARYLLSLLSLRRANKQFVAANPGFRLPPAHLAYDAYSAPDWDFYMRSGKETAGFLAATIKRYRPEATSHCVLEWGCGPARVVRHLVGAFSEPVEAYGSDYNEESIAWCTKAIPGVTFIQNGLQPPLLSAPQSFDVIYSISVFTHLSEAVSKAWITELLRVLRPGGILIVTTNGDSLQSFMLPDELEAYSTKGIVIRDNFEEGKKMFLAVHSPRYLRENLFKDFAVLEHVPNGFPHTKQDYWILRKSA